MILTNSSKRSHFTIKVQTKKQWPCHQLHPPINTYSLQMLDETQTNHMFLLTCQDKEMKEINPKHNLRMTGGWKFIVQATKSTNLKLKPISPIVFDCLD